MKLFAAGAGIAFFMSTGGSVHTAAPAVGQTARQQRGDNVLRTARRQLDGVKGELVRAPSDYGGHKAKAIEHITMAVGEIDQALAVK
jgi:hypothetical protein